MIDKAEAKKKYKETMPPMGIYQIKNLVNEKIFIGSSKNLNGKLNSHKFQLENNCHVIKKLQNDFNQFGIENFSFEVIDYLEPKEGIAYDYTEDLAALEELWLEKIRPFGEGGYNLNQIKDTR
ncbi:MAG: GIY-YIG nuclease family protein [Ignavibacteriales bacterium]|nr:GIY-YIG nuclease family protein [Ignavibacteriales bacterium]